MSHSASMASVSRRTLTTLCSVFLLTLATNCWVLAQDPGKALQFNGTTNYVNIGDKAALKPSSEITVETWVNAEQQTWYGCMLSNVWDTQLVESGYLLALDGSSGVYFGLTTQSGGLYSLQATNCITLNRWHHVAATYDGATMKLYVDGIMKSSQTKAGSIDYEPANPLTFGKYRDDNEEFFFKGKIDEIRIWSVARTQQQIQADLLGLFDAPWAALTGPDFRRSLGLALATP